MTRSWPKRWRERQFLRWILLLLDVNILENPLEAVIENEVEQSRACG
jgi:hypothetical protein